MTYIIGYKQPGLNAIISDMRVTWGTATRNTSGANSALKTGFLFPGCIFGRLGSAEHSRQFICAYKESVRGLELSVEDSWELFLRFAEAYSYADAPLDRFELLLSVRLALRPVFFLLNSSEGLVPDPTNYRYALFALGSHEAKGQLDATIADDFTPRLRALHTYLTAERGLTPQKARALSPYFLCLWLSEMSLSQESQALADAGVGGAFHFLCQSEHTEQYQRPALYILSAADRRSRTIWSWTYRVIALESGLLVEKHTPPRQDTRFGQGHVETVAIVDSASQYGIACLDGKVLQERLEADLAQQPFFYFAGFGFCHSSDRQAFGFIASSTAKKSDLFDENGCILPNWASYIIDTFTRQEDRA